MLDIDIGERIRFSLLAFVVLPTAVAALATLLVVRLVGDLTRRLAIGLYMSLASTLVTPAPIIWGDQHLGLSASQAIEGYGALFWTVGAAVAISCLAGALTIRQMVALAVGLVGGSIMLAGWVLNRPIAALVWRAAASQYGCQSDACGSAPPGAVEQAVALALIPVVGTLGVVIVVGWFISRRRITAHWHWASVRGAASATLIAAYIYIRGAADSWERGVALAVLICLPVAILALLPKATPRDASMG